MLPALVRVWYLNRSSVNQQIKKFKEPVFEFCIPYLMFFFTPIKFFKKDGDKYNFHYVLNQENEYSYFDFIEVDKNFNVFFLNKNKKVENISPELIEIYKKLIKDFSNMNLFVLMFTSAYCTVMKEKTKKKYIKDGDFFNFFNFFKAKEQKSFDDIISLIEGKGESMDKKVIWENIKQGIKIFSFFYSNFCLNAPPNANQQESATLEFSELDKNFIDYFLHGLFQECAPLKNACVDCVNTASEVLTQIEKKVNESADKVTENLKSAAEPLSELLVDLKGLVPKVSETMQTAQNIMDQIGSCVNEKGPIIEEALNNADKANQFLEGLRLKVGGFYCVATETRFPFHVSLSLDWACLSKEKLVSVVVGVGFSIKKESFSILESFYLDSIFISGLCYELIIGQKDLNFNGLSCFFFPSFFGLRRFKVFCAIRLSDHIRFSFGAAYIYERPTL
ncbi:hypothetical protein [Alphaproteobacteria bacterium endosymbiont of Tiliacea citrago]|uniref:hypothetical protein n=1 Tax=Alphaproteobacteria bacterium endosymbiont of Tiliacea citrago TaxID=3077944 RepID=UPI00313C5FD8